MVDMEEIVGAIVAIDASKSTSDMVVNNTILREILEELKAYKDTGLTPAQICEIDRLHAEKCREVAQLKK